MIAAHLHTREPCAELGIDGEWRHSRPVVVPGFMQLLGALDDLADDGQPGADPDDAHARQLAVFWRSRNVEPRIGDLVHTFTGDGLLIARFAVELVHADHLVVSLQPEPALQPIPSHD